MAILLRAGALLVAGVFKLAGFWQLGDDHLVARRHRYGSASTRPYPFPGAPDLVSLAISADPVLLVGSAGVLTVAVANHFGLSKAEVERIWLLFAV